MKSLVTTLPPIPDVAWLRPRQQMAMECALCARTLGVNGKVLGEVRHRGLPFLLWVCTLGCQAAGSATPAGAPPL